MSTSTSTSTVPLLSSVLENAQVPHQGFVLIGDAPAFSGLPLFREILRRATSRDAPVLLICALHPPSTVLPGNFPPSTKVLDLTDTIPGYSSDEAWSDVQKRILGAYSALPQGAQVFIDAIDVLAEDHSSAAALKLVRALLAAIKESKAPSRLNLLVPTSSALYQTLLSPTLSATLTLLHPLPPALVAHLSSQYLAPVSSSPTFWQILENARARRVGETLAYAAAGGMEVTSDWSAEGTSAGSSRGSAGGAVVQVLVRKATGGAKGISRSLEGLSSAPDTAGSHSVGSPVVPLSVVALETLVQVNPVSGPTTSRPGQDTADGTHDALGLPFNLSLTEEQRRRRGDVPIPYAHEGEGVELGWEEEEDDEDDEEI